MTTFKKILLGVTLLIIFFLVYVPHLDYPMPLHIDEWHHIEEGLRLGNYGEYFKFLQAENARRFTGLEIGFHFFLFLVSQFVSLVSIYQFLPALWACLSALVIFYVTYKITDGSFYLGLLSMVFFASIKSNVNITGLWFFTPLTFSIPFIYLFLYFFTEGLSQEKNKYILYSLLIMTFLLPVHSISFLFFAPVLFFILLFNYPYVAKNYKLIFSFLLLPLIGFAFYKFILDLSWAEVPLHAFEQLQFKYGWGVLEVENSFLEIYSLAGYLFAIIGGFCLIYFKQLNKFLLFLIWPLYALLLIYLYRLTGISFLSPYQRNLYYFALGLPVLSAVGFYFSSIGVWHFWEKFISNKKEALSDDKRLIRVSFNFSHWQKEAIKYTATILFGATSIFLTFNNYYHLPADLELYHPITKEDYETLQYLSSLPAGNVMATTFVSTAVYPIARKNPVAQPVFYGNMSDILDFYIKGDCQKKEELIERLAIKYVISPEPLECNFKVIHSDKKNIIYEATQ